MQNMNRRPVMLSGNYLYRGGCADCLVGLSAGLHKNYWPVFYKTWVEDGSQPNIDTINLIKLNQIKLKICHI